MPKIFSDEEKQAHREHLLDNGLHIIMEKGYKQVTVDQLVAMIGASKGYFYMLFPSKEEFFLEALAWQMEKTFVRLEEAVQRGHNSLEVSALYRDIFKNSLRFATYEDLNYVQKKIGDDQWEKFRDFQEQFFSKVLKLLGKSSNSCDPQIVSNLSALTFLLYNSQAKYLFNNKIKETTEILLHALHEYIFQQ